MPIKMKMIEITIISSISVNPFAHELLPVLDLLMIFMLPHHSEYRRPSVPVACDFEYTSKTFRPHQLVESGSSDTQRSPHSFCPVIGSFGISLRKRIFLSVPAPTFTPFTRVSRSGGYGSCPTPVGIRCWSAASS